MRQDVARWSGILVVVLATSGSVWGQQGYYGWQDFDPRYRRSVEQSALDPTTLPAENVRLTVISKNNPAQTWDGDRVLMSIFTDFAGYNRQYDEARDSRLWHGDLFATVAPELYDFHRRNQTPPDQVALRTKQLLGLPGNKSADRVVELWADSGKMFRPAYDSDITHAVPSRSFPAGDPHQQWFLQHWNQADPVTGGHVYPVDRYPPAYEFVDGRRHYYPYPWTRLGYTYDWANIDSADPNGIVGLSEFIIPEHDARYPALWNPISVRAVVSIGSYIYYDRDRGNFDVTGDCDTIWAGDLYTPVNPVAGQSPFVRIRAGGIVHEGITVSSPGFEITNDGTIRGPGKNLDRTYRDNAVQFDAGGTLVNRGMVVGPGVAVEGAAAATGAVVVHNYGTIQADHAAVRTGAGADAIYLYAGSTTQGAIETGGGDDTITITGGQLQGNIDGGSGANVVQLAPDGQSPWVYDGSMSNIGQLNLLRGQVSLNGVLQAGQTNVAPGALLAGNGVFSGNLTNRGTISPGNSIGTITVGGDYRQTAEGTLRVELVKPLDSSLQCDRINVGGNAILESGTTIRPVLAPGSQSVIRTDDSFTVLAAHGTVTADPQIVSDSAFLRFIGTSASAFGGPTWTPQGYTNQYQLKAKRTATFASAAEGSNAARLGAAMDADVDSARGNYAGLLNQALFMNAAQFNQAAEQLSPAAYAPMSQATLRTEQYLAESLADRLHDRRRGLAGRFSSTDSSVGGSSNDRSVPIQEVAWCPTHGARSYAFADPFGVYYSESTRGDAVGFDASSVGVQVGADREVDDGWILGMTCAYTHTGVGLREGRGSGQIDGFSFGPYFSYGSDGYFVDGLVGAGFHHNDFLRNAVLDTTLDATRGQNLASDVGIYLGGGIDYDFEPFTLTPSASLHYLYYSGQAFTESGDTGTALSLAAQDAHRLRSKLGVRIARDLPLGAGGIVPELFGGWAHEFLRDGSLDARFAAGQTTFAFDRTSALPDAAYFGGGLALSRGGRGALFTRYTGELSRSGTFHSCDVGLTLGF